MEQLVDRKETYSLAGRNEAREEATELAKKREGLWIRRQRNKVMSDTALVEVWPAQMLRVSLSARRPLETGSPLPQDRTFLNGTRGRQGVVCRRDKYAHFQIPSEASLRPHWRVQHLSLTHNTLIGI